MKPSPSTRLRAQVTSLRLVRERTVEYEQKITAPETAYEILRPLIEDLAQEAFFVVGLDSKNRINVVQQIGLGSAEAVAFNPGDIAKVLLLSNSTGCIVGHNVRPLQSPY